MTAPCKHCSHEDLCMFRSTAIEMIAKAEDENDKRASCPVHMMVSCERYEEAKAVTRKPFSFPVKQRPVRQQLQT